MTLDQLTADAVMEAAKKIGFELKLGNGAYGQTADFGYGCAVDVLVLANADVPPCSICPGRAAGVLGLPVEAMHGLNDGFEGGINPWSMAAEPDVYDHARAVGAEVRRRVLAGEGGAA